LRPEPFGALAYHYGNRRLTFLRSPELVRLVSEIGSHESADESMTAIGVAAERRPVFERALASLLASEVVRPRLAGAVRAG
jgi:putative mycofactocin binding protein MftB